MKCPNCGHEYEYGAGMESRQRFFESPGKMERSVEYKPYGHGPEAQEEVYMYGCPKCTAVFISYSMEDDV